MGNKERKVCINIINITKSEMEYLTSRGVPFGYEGISHTIARGRRTYYLCESYSNMKKHKQYEKSIGIK